MDIPVNAGRKRILLVDDEPNILALLENTLHSHGFEITKATSADEGLELANRQTPDLIISDVQMPATDGIHLCWLIRINSKVPDIPFIFFTGKDDPEVRINGYRAGGDAFINKQCSPRELIALVHAVLRRAEQSRHRDDSHHLAASADLKGAIQSFSFVEILQFLHTSEKSGSLNIYQEGNEGKISILGGEIQWARTNQNQGEEAIYEMTHWRSGDFYFLNDVMIDETNVSLGAMQLIMNCCQLIDDESMPPAEGDEPTTE